MRQALVALVVLVLAGSPAWAQTTMTSTMRPAGPTAPPTRVEPSKAQPTAVEGKIKTLDLSSKTLTLEDGTALKMPESIGVTGLEEGTRVIVTYKGDRDQKVVTSLIQLRESPNLIQAQGSPKP
jgi:Protein of unknown function (DUF1344)